MENKVTIKIARGLYQKLSLMVAHTGFSSVVEFIVFMMRTLASSGKGEDRLAVREARAISKSLKRFGYLKEDK